MANFIAGSIRTYYSVGFVRRRSICILLVLLAGSISFGLYSHLAKAESSIELTAADDQSAPPLPRRYMKNIDDFPSELPGSVASQIQNLAPQVGGVDTSFNANVSGGSAQVFSLATQPDGKFLVGGVFSSVNGVSRRFLERFNADGSRDLTFNPGGAGANGSVYVIRVLADGRLMIGGGFTTYNGTTAIRIARLNPDGTFDPSFAPQGTSANGGLQDLVIQPDGKILISGGFTSFNAVARGNIARLNADGTLDTAFNPNANGFAEEIVLRPNGKIVIVGGFTTVGGVAQNGIAGLNADGTLDPAFNIGTGAQFNVDPGAVYGVEIQSDGKIIIGGFFNAFNGTPRPGVARLNTDGSVDSTFVPDLDSGSVVEYFAIQPDGKILVAGFAAINVATAEAVARLNTNGTIDPSFIPGLADDTGYVVTVQADGKILFGGLFLQYEGIERTGIVRLNPNGTPDSFSAILAADPSVQAIARQSDGKIVIGGQFRRVGGIARRNLARLNADGTLDTTFDPGPSTEGYSRPYIDTVSIQTDGKILAGGSFNSFSGTPRINVVRVNSNGSADNTFNYLDATFPVLHIEPLPTGKILLLGFFQNAAQQISSGIVQLNSNGTYDTSLVGSGANNVVRRIVLFPSQSIIVGNFTNYNGTARNRIARLNLDGSLDTTFDPGTGANGTILDVAKLSNNQVYIGGAFTTYNGTSVTRIARLNTTGSLDTTFVSGTGFNSTVNTISVEADNSALVGGNFTTYNGSGTAAFTLAHLNLNGTIDTAFTSQPNSTVSRLLRQPDGRTLVAGFFTTIGGVSRTGFARLDATPGGSCTSVPIVYGQSINGSLTSASCVVNGPTDQYTFSGTAGQQVAISLNFLGTTGLTASLQLANVGGTNVVASNSGTGNARIPATGFFTLPSTDTYTIRVSSAAGTFSDYIVSLNLQPVQACTYSISPSSASVTPSGGTFFFDVLTQSGCPGVTASLGANSSHLQILSNTGGRVTYSVASYSGSADRTGTIIVDAPTPLTHTVTQFGVTPPTNDNFANAQVLAPGGSTPITVTGRNTGATVETGEPNHGGPGTPSRSVWYRWTAPADDLYSFTTSGSGFDTVMAIYTGSAVNGLTQTAANDDTTAFDTSSKINFRATQGTVYSIAVDGKNGATGNIVLTYSRYRRLFRLYLQNFNGFPSPITPTSVTALRQDGTGPVINAVFVSQGVYEFDLPNDNSPYIASIAGPTGVVWQPSTYLIDNTAARFNELMDGATGGGQNQTSNPSSTIPKKFKGFINGITTPAELAALQVKIATPGTASAQSPRDCEEAVLIPGGPGGTMRVRYTCKTELNSVSQIIPNAAQTAFQASVLNLPVLDTDTGPSDSPAFVITASAAATYNITGQVLAGSQGLSNVNIDVTSGTMTTRVMSDANGNYTVPNLSPGQVYTLQASLGGYIFNPQTVNLQPPGATQNIPAITCTYALAAIGSSSSFPSTGGTGQFSVTATASQQCGWTAVRDSSWINIQSGSSVGNGQVQFSVESNAGRPARQGSIFVGTQPFTITQASGCTFGATLNGVSNFPAAGGTGSFTVTASDGQCQQTPAANDYCMVSSLGSSTTGNGTLNFTIGANNGVARSALITIGTQQFTLTQAAAATTRNARFDFDGDKRADIGVYRPDNGLGGSVWYVAGSTTPVPFFTFGIPGDVPVAGDYDGDGKTDFAVWRPSNGVWFSNDSSQPPLSNVRVTQFGIATDKPVPADYDGDGKTDVAVFRPSEGNWYRLFSNGNGGDVVRFGLATDIPVPGDYDGDGKADIAVWRPSNGLWFAIRSSDAQIVITQFGANGDKPVQADYDGDGKTDLAVYRPSAGDWYRINSSNQSVTVIRFGLATDIPVPADYNGDSTADIALYRPSEGTWYIWSCTNNPLNAVIRFGLSTDKPVTFTGTP
jgi:uncharacterized delta-60 repeat protein